MTTKNIHAAFVIDTHDSYDENGVQVVDILTIQPVGYFTYIIKTKQFDDSGVEHGAGESLTERQIEDIINFLSVQKTLKHLEEDTVNTVTK